MGLAAHHRLATLRHWTRWRLNRALPRANQDSPTSLHRIEAVTVGADPSPRGESNRVRGRSGDGVGCAPPVGDTAPLDTVTIKPRLAPRLPGQPNKPSPHRSVTVGGVNPRGERLFGVDRPAVTVGADPSPRGESMRVRGRSGDGVGCAPPVGDTAPLDTLAIKPRLAPRLPGQPNKPSPHEAVTVGADQSPRGESNRVRGRSGDGVGCAPPVGDTAPLDTVTIKPRLAPRRPGQPNARSVLSPRQVKPRDCRCGSVTARRIDEGALAQR